MKIYKNVKSVTLEIEMDGRLKEVKNNPFIYRDEEKALAWLDCDIFILKCLDFLKKGGRFDLIHDLFNRKFENLRSENYDFFLDCWMKTFQICFANATVYNLRSNDKF